MFVVSQDLQFFVHDHPVFEPDGDFVYNLAFPKPGMYRVLGDFYPDGATPQLIAKTVLVPGTPPPPAVPRNAYPPPPKRRRRIIIMHGRGRIGR